MKRALRNAVTPLLLIVIAALCTRSAFAWYQERQFSPRVLSIVPFQTETGHIAYSIASGKGFSSPFQRDTGPTAWLAPVYPYLLAGIFRLFGIYTLSSFFAALFLNILFSAGACIPIFYTGEKIAGRGVGIAGAWLWALFPNAILIPFEWIWDTCLSALLVAVLLWATLKLEPSPRLRGWCFYGALWGFALLTNPAIALLFPVLVAWAAYRARTGEHSSKWLIGPVLAAAIAALCCTPWTVRNYLQFHKFIPLRSNFAFELYVGNNENYDEQYRFRPGPITQEREILRYLSMGESSFMEEEKRKAVAFIESHPRVEVWLISQRVVDFWTGTATPVATFRRTGSPWLRFILLCNYATSLCAFAGIVVLLAGKNDYSFPVVVIPVVFPLLYYVTHTSLRYRHPIDPIVLLLAAIGIHGAWSWFPRKNLKMPTEQPAST